MGRWWVGEQGFVMVDGQVVVVIVIVIAMMTIGDNDDNDADNE